MTYKAPARSVGRLKRPFGNLYYEVTGSGPALLFAHGLGGNQMSWWQQVAHFAPHYTCVAFAHRGFAPSDRDRRRPRSGRLCRRPAGLIDHLGFADVRLVGQSMGGWTMLEYAIAHPAKVKALVLSSTSGTIDRRGCRSVGRRAVRRLGEGRRGEDRRRPAPTASIPRWARPAAARSPALHLLYESIDEMAGALDKEKVRAGLRRTARRTRRPS